MLNAAALVVGANAIDSAIGYAQAHSGARGANGTTNAVGSRVAVNGTVDAAGKITWTGIAFTGLNANQAVAEVSFWSAATNGTYYGGGALTGDATANSAGEFTVTQWTETPSSS
jgi:hypothetical protein